MSRYLRLYWTFMKNCLVREMESRGNFFVGLLVIFLFPWFPLLLIGAIYSQTNTISGWTLPEYLTLVGTFQIISALVYMFFLKNIFNMPEYIRKGELDFYLLKPVNSQFLISTRYVSFSELAQAIPGTGLVIYGALNSGLEIDWWRWLVYLVFVICGVLIAYSVWFMLVLPTIWWVKMDSLEFFFSLFDLARYHPSMFGGAIQIIMSFVLPLGIVASIPSDVLTNRIGWAEAGWGIAAAGICLWLSNRLWRFAQTRYYGASS